MKAELINKDTLALGPFDYNIVAELPEYYIGRQQGTLVCNIVFVHKETLDLARMIRSKSPMEII